METSKYVLYKNKYVIKRVKENEEFKSPKISMEYRNKLLAPVLDAEFDESKNQFIPPKGMVRGKSVKNADRLIKGSKFSKEQYLMRTLSKISCGNQCVDGTMTWISDDDLRDYVHTMPITSIGKVVTDIELFDMSQGIDFSSISQRTVNCIHRILSQTGKNLIPYNDCEILHIFRDIIRHEGLSDSSDESVEIDMLISLAFGSKRLSLNNQIKVLRAYQVKMINYVKREYKLSEFEARDRLYNLQGNDLWKGDWWKFTQKFGFSVSEGNITPYKLIEEWISNVEEYREIHRFTDSQRCSIYSYDLLLSLLLCIISENMDLNMSGYYYNPRHRFRLKDEQREFCLNAGTMEMAIIWSNSFKCNTFIESLKHKMRERGNIRKKTKKRRGKRSKSKKKSK